MSDKIDPTADPKAAAKAVAEKPSETEVNEFAAKVAAHLGKDMGEMFQAYVAQRTENAEKAVEAKPEEASQADEANPFKAKAAREWLAELTGQPSVDRAEKDLTPRRAFATALSYMAGAKSLEHGFDAAVKDKALGQYEGFVAKTLGMDVFASGGALTQPQQAAEVVGSLLSEIAVMGDPGIEVIPIDGEMEFPRVTTSPTERWTAENAAANATTMEFSRNTIRPEDVSIIVPVSNKLLRGSPMAVAALERELSRRLSERIDAKLIRSIGVSNTPIGLRYLVASANIITANASPNDATFEDDLLKLMTAVHTAKVQLIDPRFAISPRTRRFAFAARGTDSYLFRQDMLTGKLLGVKMAGQSGLGVQNIPENLSYTGTSESEIYFYETSGLKIGVGSDMAMKRLEDVAYNDASGSVQSAFSRNQTVFGVRASVGLGEVNSGLGIAVMPDCDYGA